MAETLKKLFQGQLGTSDAALFTGTAGHVYTIALLYITNTDNADRTFRLHAVDAAGASSAANALFYDTNINMNSTLPATEFRGLVLTGAEMIRGLASVASKITVTAFGVDAS